MNDESIFDEARRMSIEDRAVFVENACSGNAELKKRVEVLLTANDQKDSLLDEPILAQPTDDFVTSIEQPGQSIGPYKLLQKIGEGGFGVVYLAEQQEPVRRRVALKVIKPGMDSRQVIARFEAERQALAMMDHPNIAKVHDAGMTPNGRPYFVMELVKALPITQFCDERKLSPRERLELFVPICNAIQHAHQKGIIHRDIKPSNILVTLYDGEPVPKVIDFGVAKAMQHRLTEKTVFTQFGQVIGTLEYMSPEQAEMNQLDIDTRADIYSLGAVLYELLTGVTPLDRNKLRSAAFDEMLRVIREDEPVRPSMRLSSTEQLASISAQRRLDPAKLTRMVHGELDWIVMKALEKQRARRYETPSGLGQDIQRYLDDEAVEASPPSTTYRLRKSLVKHGKSISVAVGFVLLLAAAALVSGIQWRRNASLAVQNADALRQTQRSLERATSAEEAMESALSKAQIAARAEKSGRLAALSESSRDRYPQRSVLLAMESIRATESDGVVQPVARNALFQAVRNIGGQPLTGQGNSTRVLRTSSDGNWLFVAYENGESYLTDLRAPSPFRNTRRLNTSGRVCRAEFSPTGRWLATGTEEQKIRLWDLSADNLITSSRLLPGNLRTENWDPFVFSEDGRWLFTSDADRHGQLWDLQAIADDGEIAPNMLASSFKTDEQRFSYWRADFGPEGRWLYSKEGQGRGSKSRLWRLPQDRSAPQPIDSPIEFRAQTFSRDGRWMMAGNDNSLHAIDLNRDNPLESPRVIADAQVIETKFSPNGRWFLATMRGGCRIWDLKEADLDVASIESSVLLHTGGVGGEIVFSDDSRWLAMRTDNTTLRLWDLAADTPRPRLLPPDMQAILNLSISSNSRWLVTAPWSGNVFRLYDLDSKDPAGHAINLVGHDGDHSERAMAEFSGDGRWLFTAKPGDPPRIWDMSRDRSVASAMVFPELLSTDGNGRWMIVGTERTVTRVSVLEENLVDDVAVHTDSPSSFAKVSSDGRWLLTQDLDESISPDELKVRLWDLDTRTGKKFIAGVATPNQRFTSLQALLDRIAFSPDGKWLASRWRPEEKAPWQVRMLKLRGAGVGSVVDLATYENRSTVEKLVIGPDSRWLVATGYQSGDLHFWNLISPDIAASRKVFSHDEPTDSMHFSTNHRWLFTCSERGTVRRWDLQESGTDVTQPDMMRIPDNRSPYISAVSSNGEWFVTRSKSDEETSWEVRVWSFQKDSDLQIPVAARICSGREAAITDDGRFLATGEHEDVEVWDLHDLDEAEPKMRFGGHIGRIFKIQFTEDEKRLIVQDISGAGYVCYLSLDTLLTRAKELVGRELNREEQMEFLSEDIPLQ